MRIGDFLERHRNAFLVLLVSCTFIVGTQVNRQEDVRMLSIPVAAPYAAEDAVEAYRARRDSAQLRDMAALEAILARDDADRNTRNAASAALADLVHAREASLAIEGALVTSSLSPCVAVVDAGLVTVVSEASAISERESALVIELAAVHAGIDAANVRIITP